MLALCEVSIMGFDIWFEFVVQPLCVVAEPCAL